MRDACAAHGFPLAIDDPVVCRNAATLLRPGEHGDSTADRHGEGRTWGGVTGPSQSERPQADLPERATRAS